MEKQTIFIKGMVCNRCVMAVKSELENLGHQSVDVSLGEVRFSNPPSGYNKDELESKLSLLGFRLLEDKNMKMTNEVKKLAAEVYSGSFDFPDGFRFSKLLADRLGKPYEHISDTFSATEKRTIEHYIIDFRINKVKEFLVYTALPLSAIAFQFNFNSVAHLSAQFKQHTGLTPSFFKELRKAKSETVFSAN